MSPKPVTPFFDLPSTSVHTTFVTSGAILDFKNNVKKTISNSKPIFESYLIPQPGFLSASHSATFEVLNDGTLFALWFAGSHEGKPDVKIWSSRFQDGKWRKAIMVVSPEMLSKRLDQFIKKVGNPVIYRDSNDRLHLFVVSVGAIGGWSGSSLNQLISYDDGRTWTIINKLILSPFFNFSTLARTRAIDLKDGGFYLPAYHELMSAYPLLLRFDRYGNYVQQIRMTTDSLTLLQPAIAVHSSMIGYAFMRNLTNRSDPLYMQMTHDAGLTWSKPRVTNLTNHNSSLAVMPIGCRQLLMVHSPGDDRSTLAISISKDGYKWQTVYLLEHTPNAEFSYPAIQVHDGVIDILYTWNRKKIKHVHFNQAWLNNLSYHSRIYGNQISGNKHAK